VLPGSSAHRQTARNHGRLRTECLGHWKALKPLPQGLGGTTLLAGLTVRSRTALRVRDEKRPLWTWEAR
jgi:hypothetical protein